MERFWHLVGILWVMHSRVGQCGEVDDVKNSCNVDPCWVENNIDLSSLLCQIATLNAEVKDLHQEVGRLTAALEKAETPVYGFLARIPYGTNINIRTGEAIKFPQTLENYGNGYNPSTGKFTCPINGLYQFSASILLLSSSERLEIGLYKNGDIQGDIIVDPANNWELGTTSISITCNAGDEVHVTPRWPLNVTRTIHSLWNMFSGALIRKL